MLSLKSDGAESVYINLFKLVMSKIQKVIKYIYSQILNVIHKELGLVLCNKSLQKDNLPIIMQNIKDAIQAIKSFNFSSTFLEQISIKHILPCLSHLVTWLDNKDSKSLGVAFVSIALCELDVCLLEIPVDPYDFALAKLEIAQGKEERINAKVIVHSEMCIWKYGQMPSVDDMLYKRSLLEEKIKSMLKKKVHRPTESKINDIIQDFRNLRQLILSNQEMFTNIYQVENAFEQVVHLDKSLTAASKRLKNRYPLYQDITSPVLEAVYYLKCGLFLIVKDHLMVSSQSVKLLSNFHKFIGLSHYEGFLSLLGEFINSSLSKSDLLECFIYSLNMLILYHSGNTENISSNATSMRIVVGFLSNIALTWKENAEWHSAEVLEKDELYKYKSETYKDETLDDDEYVSVYFPDFYATFENDVPLKKSQNNYIIPDSTVFSILEAHRLIFMDSSTLSAAKFQDLWARNFRQGYEISARLMTQSGKYYPVDIDYSSQTASAYMSSCYSANAFSGNLYDFYSDPDIEEANLVVVSVQKFAKRLKSLLQEFPDHHVLQYLDSFCEKIIKLPIKTPIIKLLNGIEILLQKSQDWESYAHKKGSLSNEIADISSCIVRLRKKELYSWKDLFALERRKSSVKAAKLWVNLWEMIIIPLLNPMSEVFCHLFNYRSKAECFTQS